MPPYSKVVPHQEHLESVDRGHDCIVHIIEWARTMAAKVFCMATTCPELWSHIPKMQVPPSRRTEELCQALGSLNEGQSL